MNITEKLEELRAQREELSKRIAESKVAAKKLDQVIKKLTKTVSETESLLDGIPVIEDDTK